MPETKSFRNVTISDGGLGITLYPRAESDWTPLGTFYHADWDVEVIFKRKPRAIKVDDRVQERSSANGTVGRVVGLHPGGPELPGGTWAWVVWGTGISPCTSNLTTLKHAEGDV